MRPRSRAHASSSRPVLLASLLLASTVLAGCMDGAEPVAEAPNATGPARVNPDVFFHTPAGLVDASQAANMGPMSSLLRDVGATAFEPTLGVTSDGSIFYAAFDGPGPLLGVAPIVLRSQDLGLTWEDVSPRLPTGQPMPPETYDPYLHVDPATDRVFQFAMFPILACAWLSWSDDGGATWTSNPHGCGNTPPWDHQTLAAAPPAVLPTVGYASVLHQCVNNLVASTCSRSLDGGLTWTPGAPAFVPQPIVSPYSCHGLHGHLVAAPDGTVYLPKDMCGISTVAISRDDGTTWETVVVSEVPTQDWSDPAMAVDAAGNAYYAFVDEVGAIMMSVSRDAGRSWSEAVVASPPGVTGHMPALAAGDAGRIALAYPGTEDIPEGYAHPDFATPESERPDDSPVNKARWNAYLAVSTDALDEAPLFQTARANDPEDPLVRGTCGPARCPGMVDFIDVVIGPEGRPFASFVDACRGKCATPEGTHEDSRGLNSADAGVLVTLAQGPRLVGEGMMPEVS